MPLQVVNKADEVEILEEAETIAKGDKADQLLALISKKIQPHEFASQVSEVTGYSLDVHPIEHVGCCGHQVIPYIYVCNGRYGGFVTHTILNVLKIWNLYTKWKCWT